MKFLILVQNRPGSVGFEDPLTACKAAQAYLSAMLAKGVLDKEMARLGK